MIKKICFIKKNALFNKIAVLPFCLITFFCVFSQKAISQDGSSSYYTYTINQSVASDVLSVTAGEAVMQGIKTSYGYVFQLEGKMICAISENGTILWQKGYSSNLSPYLTVCSSDLILTVTSRNQLNLINPSGALLWNAQLPFDIIENPLWGKDGRFFIKGKENLSCYGINGICRWNLETEACNEALPLTQLNDGSILYFTKRTSDKGTTIALRISPFGKFLEEIIFSGHVVEATSTSNGTLICFQDGSVGCVNIKNNEAQSLWGISRVSGILSENTRFAGEEDNTLYLLTGSNTLVSINKNSGLQEAKINLTGLSGLQDIKFLKYVSDQLTVCTSTQAYGWKTDGSVIWHADYSGLKNWKYIMATDSGYLDFLCRDWTVKCYRVTQGTSRTSSFKESPIENYSQFYSEVKYSLAPDQRAISQNQYNFMINAFRTGNFGEYEDTWLPLIQEELYRLRDDYSTVSASFMDSKPLFKADTNYAAMILTLAGESGLLIYNKTIQNLMKKSDFQPLLTTAASSFVKTGYDPDLEVLNAIDYLIKYKISSQDTLVLNALCDATYQICHFMGRDAFYARGQEIITGLLSQQYSSRTKQKAIETLRKIIDLKI